MARENHSATHHHPHNRTPPSSKTQTTSRQTKLAEADECYTGSINLLQQRVFEIWTNVCSGTGVRTLAGTSGQASLIGHARWCWTATLRNAPALPNLQPEKITQENRGKGPTSGSSCGSERVLLLTSRDEI